MKKLLIIAVLISGVLTTKTYSQIAISYYPFQSILSVSSSPEKTFWGDLRIETNTFFSNINLEFDVMVNIKKTERVNYYAGLGINVNPFYGLESLPFTNGYTLNTGVKIKPFLNHQKFQVAFELSAYFNKNFDGGLLRTLLGVSYNL